MLVRCSAPRCTNSNKKGYCCTTFAQDPNSRQKWIDAAEIPCWKSSKSVLLYEIGSFYSSELYRVDSKKLVRKDVIPSLFCKYESVKLEKRKKLKHVIHNDSCCVKKLLPVDIKMLKESANKTVSVVVELLQIYSKCKNS